MTFKLALRALSRRPGLTLAAIATLALGIGASTAIFSVVDAIFLRPLPYRDADRLVMIWDQLNRLGLDRFTVRHAHYLDYRDRNSVFDDIAGFEYFDVNLTGEQGPERVNGMRVTPNLIPMLGVPAALGRPIAYDDREDSAMLSQSLWQRRFGGDPSIVGRTIAIDGAALRVIGVLPASYAWPIATSIQPEVWIPITIRPDPERRRAGLRLIARLKPGVAIMHADDDMKSVSRGVDEQHRPYRGPRGEDPGYTVKVVGLRQEIYGTLPRTALLLMSAAALVLAIACANVAHLLLAAGASREKEFAVRRAMGAGAWRIMGELLAQSALLAAGGALCGVLLARWGAEILVALGPEPLSAIQQIGMDFRVLVFSSALAATTALAFGLAPGLRLARGDLGAVLKSGPGRTSRRGPRLADVLVTAQVALCLVLLAGAGLLLRSFLKLVAVDPGFEPDRVLTLRISLAPNRYGAGHQQAAFFDQVLTRVGRLPGVAAAGAVSRLPLSGVGRGGDPFSIEGRAWGAGGAVPQFANHQAATPDYFRTMGIPLLAGRKFTGSDQGAGERVVLINETLAHGFFAGENPLGKRILLGAPRPAAPWLTIVGVVGDVRNSGLETAPIPQMYEPYAQHPIWSAWLAVRVAANPEALVAAIRGEVAAVDRDQPVYDVRTMSERLDRAVAQPRFQGTLMAVFAAVALALAAVGLYGVVAHSTARRTREIGVRMALGARPGDVVALVLRQPMTPVIAGAVLGAAGAAGLAHTLRTLLFGVSAADPTAFAAAVGVLASVSFVACWLPARRAARVDPARTLRQE